MIRDLTNQRFGRLKIICPTKKFNKNRSISWLCRCDCGNLIEVVSYSLIKGRTQSCGCLLKEKSRKRAINNKWNLKHGDTPIGKRTRLYRIWRNMRERCSNPNLPAYKYYGAKNISVCKEWINNYPAFKFWALLSGYTDNLTIDRIDNKGDYESDNCWWITRADNIKKSWKERRAKCTSFQAMS